MIEDSAFRTFCRNKWFEHSDEIFNWSNSPVGYDDKYYFNKHKWLLKRMFKDENNAD